MIVRTSDELRFRVRSLNRGLFNPSTLRHRQFDGFIASMQQSGSHWLKYMLGLTLARLYDLPPPAHIQDDAIQDPRRSTRRFHRSFTPTRSPTTYCGRARCSDWFISRSI